MQYIAQRLYFQFLTMPMTLVHNLVSVSFVQRKATYEPVAHDLGVK
jgi:hypothetical protein